MKLYLLIPPTRWARQLSKLFTWVVLPSAAVAQTYTITDLGTLGPNDRYNYSVAYSINSSGQVGGASSAPSSQKSDPAFLYSGGQLINIGTLGGEYGQARSINTSGQ